MNLSEEKVNSNAQMLPGKCTCAFKWQTVIFELCELHYSSGAILLISIHCVDEKQWGSWSAGF